MDKADEQRATYLNMCEELMDRASAMRSYGMKPGNAWLAKAELAKIGGLITELEAALEDIKQSDQGRN